MQMLSTAGFPLRKWASNSTELMEAIHPDLRSSSTSLSIDSDKTVKPLVSFGILHQTCSSSKVNPSSPKDSLTKRTLLSAIAKIFDPVGWLSPITINHKKNLLDYFLKTRKSNRKETVTDQKR
ncbi:unnamed protein product [Larinioides sclopetarius]|uniref:Uncharacterized protein n=1 Tax=Larinioides sclopetarius TaxID=280406 RepID=A0AAV2APG4_9ARAC